MAVEQQSKKAELSEVRESTLTEVLERLEQQGANKATMEFGMNSYLDLVARKRNVPLKGTFELTPLCNLNCKMCYVHLSKEQVQQSERKMLTGSQWKAIMSQAIENGLMYVLLTGGEAMLHPDFDEIYLYLLEQGLHVSVNTNALLLDEKRVAFFQAYRPREIHITLYGANDNVYEAVTGRRAFEQVMEGIRRAKEAALPIVVNITPNRYMSVDDVLTLVQTINSLGVRYGINSSLSKPREETGRDQVLHDLTLDEYIQLYKRVNLLQGEPLKSIFEDEIPNPGGSVRDELRGFRCGGGRSSFAVVWYGAMQPCLTITDVQADVLSTPFIQAWQLVNNAVCNYPIPRECSGCAFEKICPVCVAQHAEDAPLGHASPRLCERVRRLIREGLVAL